MASLSVAVSDPPRQPISREDLHTTLRRFRLHLLADAGLSPGTASTYVRMMSKILRSVGTVAPGHDDLREHVAMLREAGRSHSFVANTCLVIERFTVFAGAPLKLGRGKKPKPAPKQALSEGEVAVILAACKNSRERAILSILAYSGMRNDELCQLRTSDVSMADQSIRITHGKGGHGRAVRVSARCIADVQAYLVEHPRIEVDPLFVSHRQHRPLEGSTVRRIVRRVVRRTGIRKRVHPHIFRHSLAVNMLARGASLFAIKDILGHSHISTTLIYLRSADSRQTAQYEMFCPSYS